MTNQEMPPRPATSASGFPSPNGAGPSHPAQTVTREEEDAARNAPDARLRAIIVVSNPVSRCGLESMLRETPNICHVAVASCADQAADDLRRHRFDLVIASADMAFGESPGLLEATRIPGVQLLLMLRGQYRDEVTRAALADADGYLVEEELTPQVLSETIRRLARGEILLTKSFVQSVLVRSHEMRCVRLMQVLTQRERHVLRLLVEGLSNKQIATKLSISEHGAKRHVANLLAKLNCANRTHAVALALQEGLLNVQPSASANSGGPGA